MVIEFQEKKRIVAVLKVIRQVTDTPICKYFIYICVHK